MTWMIHAIYAGYLLLLFLSVVSPLLQRPLVDYGMLAIAVTPALLIFYRKLFRDRFWQAIAAAHIVWGIAQVFWILNIRYGLISVTVIDYAYLIFKLLILAAVLYRSSAGHPYAGNGRQGGCGPASGNHASCCGPYHRHHRRHHE